MTNDKHSRFSLVIAVGACVGIALVIAGVMFLFLNNRPSAQPLLAQGTAIQSAAQPLLPTASPDATLAQATPTPTATQSLLPTVRPEATLALPHDPTKAAEWKDQYQFINEYNEMSTSYYDALSLFTYYTDIMSGTDDVNISAQVAPNPLSIFTITSIYSLSFTLTMPDGRLLTPEFAASDPLITYTVRRLGQDAGFYSKYIVQQPIPGTWQIHVQRQQADAVTVFGYDLLPFKLVTIDGGGTYLPGEQVKITARLVDETKPEIMKDTKIVGNIRYNIFDSSLTSRSFTFVDDGTNGDDIVGDGIYTAQFEAENLPGIGFYTITATNGLITRMTVSNISIDDLRTLRKTAAFVPDDETHQIVTASMPDTDGDGYGDALDLTASFVVSETGAFEINGTLTNRTNATEIYTTTLNYNADQTQFEPGLHTLRLRFDGIQIRNSGTQGPYTLQKLVLRDHTTRKIVKVDTRTDIFTTTLAQEMLFKGPPFKWVQTMEQGIDFDGNGIFDMLRIEIFLDASQWGDYVLSGRLVDSEQHTITTITSKARLENRGFMVLEILGADIKANGRDGPYRLVDLHIRQTSNIINNQPVDMALTEVYTTAPFKVSQFEAPPPTPTLPTNAIPEPTAET